MSSKGLHIKKGLLPVTKGFCLVGLDTTALWVLNYLCVTLLIKNTERGWHFLLDLLSNVEMIFFSIVIIFFSPRSKFKLSEEYLYLSFTNEITVVLMVVILEKYLLFPL